MNLWIIKCRTIGRKLWYLGSRLWRVDILYQKRALRWKLSHFCLKRSVSNGILTICNIEIVHLLIFQLNQTKIPLESAILWANMRLLSPRHVFQSLGDTRRYLVWTSTSTLGTFGDHRSNKILGVPKKTEEINRFLTGPLRVPSIYGCTPLLKNVPRWKESHFC